MSISVESKVPSVTTSVTQEEKTDPNSAGKEETSSSLEDDWEDDPANPRNWPIRKKWVATAIVNAIASYILLLRLIFLL